VANAIYDGSDAVMLSGETAIGDYPIESVACMDRIARHAEADPLLRYPLVPDQELSMEDDLAGCACQLAESTQAKAIIVPTLTGKAARLVARHRPRAAIVAPVPELAVRRQIAIVWGVHPVALDMALPAGSDRLDVAVRSAAAARLIHPGDRVVVLAGHPIEGGARWPTIRLVSVGADGSSVEP
jgi:pyruvate kinase